MSLPVDRSLAQPHDRHAGAQPRETWANLATLHRLLTLAKTTSYALLLTVSKQHVLGQTDSIRTGQALKHFSLIVPYAFCRARTDFVQVSSTQGQVMSRPTCPYRYDPLDTTVQQMRLLWVRKDPGEHQICCVIETFDMTNIRSTRPYLICGAHQNQPSILL